MPTNDECKVFYHPSTLWLSKFVPNDSQSQPSVQRPTAFSSASKRPSSAHGAARCCDPRLPVHSLLPPLFLSVSARQMWMEAEEFARFAGRGEARARPAASAQPHLLLLHARTHARTRTPRRSPLLLPVARSAQPSGGALPGERERREREREREREESSTRETALALSSFRPARPRSHSTAAARPPRSG